MRKVQIVALVLAVVASFIPGVWAQESFRIGIAQITEHPALDAARAGFIDGMEELGYVAGENVQYDLYSAQGDMSIAQTIAQKLVIDDVDRSWLLLLQWHKPWPMLLTPFPSYLRRLPIPLSPDSLIVSRSREAM